MISLQARIWWKLRKFKIDCFNMLLQIYTFWWWNYIWMSWWGNSLSSTRSGPVLPRGREGGDEVVPVRDARVQVRHQRQDHAGGQGEEHDVGRPLPGGEDLHRHRRLPVSPVREAVQVRERALDQLHPAGWGIRAHEVGPFAFWFFLLRCRLYHLYHFGIFIKNLTGKRCSLYEVRVMYSILWIHLFLRDH